MALDDNKFIAGLQEKLREFSLGYLPLTTKQINRLKQSKLLIAQDASHIVKNIPKKRAHTILTELWTHLPEVYFLCSLAFTQTELASLKSRTYLAAASRWWHEVDKPQGLTRVIDLTKDALPSVLESPPNSREVQIPITCKELFSFLLEQFGDTQLQISCPYNGIPLPFVRLGSNDSFVKMEMSVSMVHAIGRQVMQRQAREKDS
ncbi:hypothetical protein FPOAC2_14343 [Fusarium poae]|jgi:hypothetical protein|uniref:uncharacterized protein n=1 Tax=Fusarium poae TaxID=36050 RepID=UPI001D052C92|nr:uncharacterized protein FPOAC1_013779 [Fusarium poae]XP_044701598.1 uncharacterized protein FPOAC1_013073 [Fusarium poae]KAG8664441.1 hypothetical protein FPOAC1_013779 [Fusarium poae]KAG8665095.1 hypothetical protein FPOAC1_013073 [Fusarium poae]